jgi:hypothetical protein
MGMLGEVVNELCSLLLTNLESELGAVHIVPVCIPYPGNSTGVVFPTGSSIGLVVQHILHHHSYYGETLYKIDFQSNL